MKSFFGLLSGSTTEIFAVFVQADIPQDSTEITLVPGAMTAMLISIPAD